MIRAIFWLLILTNAVNLCYTSKSLTMKMKKLLTALAIVSVVILSGCKKDDFVGKVGVCPVVLSTVLTNGATEVPVKSIITVTFNTNMNPATITQSSFSIQGPSKVQGSILYDGTGPTLTFIPDKPLLYSTTYTGRVAASVKDFTGNALQKDYVWSFTTLDQYTLTVTSNPLTGGITTGGGAYDSGSTVTAGATANSGYAFSGWTEGGVVVSTDAGYVFKLTGNRTLVANFTENIKVYNIALSSNPLVGGATTGGGSYNAGTAVTVGATANSGYTFTSWTEGGAVVSTNSAYSFTISGDRTLVANFTINVFTIDLFSNPLAGGSTTGGGIFNYGSSVTIGATANAGYSFVNWTEGTTIISTNPGYTFTVTGHRNLVANFTENIKVYNITLSSNPTNGGTTAGGGSFNDGASVTVVATANAGYTFASWTEGTAIVSNNPGYTFIIGGNRNLVANFTENTKVYSVGVSSNPQAGGTTTGGGSYNEGTIITVRATTNSGYTFANWTEGTIIVSTNPGYSFTVTGHRNLVANFTENIKVHNVALSSDPPAGGTTTGGGSYNYGSSVSIQATASPGYYFSAWTDGPDVISTEASYTFTITGDRNLVANFRETIVVNTLTLSANPLAGGVVTGGGSFNSGTIVTVRAFANGGYNFTNWMDGGAIISTDATYAFTLSSNRNLVANFTKGTEINCIQLLAFPLDGGTTSGGGTYTPGTSVTIVATINPGYTFLSWTENGRVVSFTERYTFIMAQTRYLVANFIKGPGAPAAKKVSTRNQ